MKRENINRWVKILKLNLLDKQTAKILALSSGNVRKYKFFIGKNVLLGKKTVTIQIFDWINTIRQWTEKKKLTFQKAVTWVK